MPEEPELASVEEIEALRARWLDANPEYRPKPKASEPKSGGWKWRPGENPGKWKGFERVAAEYRASEEKRKEARPWFNKPAEERKKRKIDAEDEHFERVFKEKGLGDESYYGVRAGMRRNAKTI